METHDCDNQAGKTTQNLKAIWEYMMGYRDKGFQASDSLLGSPYTLHQGPEYIEVYI